MTRFALIASPIVFGAVLALAACSKPAAPANESDIVPLPPTVATAPAAPAPTAAPVAPAQPSGPAAALTASTDQLSIDAASVTDLVWLPDLDAKLFSTAGGDPAINGLYTHIAFPPENNGDNWSVFQIGNFESWKVIEQAPGRIVLQVRESHIDPSTGNPLTEDKKLIVTFTSGATPSASVTPAT